MKFLLITLLSFSLNGCSNEHNFIDNLPHSFKLNETTEADLKSKGLTKDIAFSDNSLNRYTDKDENKYYTRKANSSLSQIEVFKVPNSWEEAGLKIGASGVTRAELLSILNAHKILFLVYIKSDGVILATSRGIDFEFLFSPIDAEVINMKKDRLFQINITSIDPIKHNNSEKYREPTAEELGISAGKNSNENEDKYLGTWISGNMRITITKFGDSYRLTGCENCPFTAVVKDGIFYVSTASQQLPCPYDEKSDRILIEGREYRRDKD